MSRVPASPPDLEPDTDLPDIALAPVFPKKISPHPPMARGVVYLVWEPFLKGLGLAVVLVVTGLVALLGRFGQPPASDLTWAKDARTLWTGAESKRLADMPIFTTPFFSSSGPPPFTLTPRTGAGSVPVRGDGTPGSVRTNYDRAMRDVVDLSGVWSDPSREPGPLDGSMLAAVLGDLDRSEVAMGPLERSRESLAVNYHLALAAWWIGDPETALQRLAAARTDGGKEACPQRIASPVSQRRTQAPWPLSASTRVRAGVAACLWLQGRAYAELGNYDKAADRLGLALRVSNGLRVGRSRAEPESQFNAIGSLNGQEHLIEAPLGELWRDYISAQLARESVLTPRENDPTLESLLRRSAPFADNDEVAALARVWALRMGRPDLAQKIPLVSLSGELGAVNQAAMIVAGLQTGPPAGVEGFNGAEKQLRDWRAHNCLRAATLRAASESCGNMSFGFSTWRYMQWRPEFERNLNGSSSWLGQAIELLRLVSTALLILAGVLAFYLGLKSARYREARYREVFGSRHYFDFVANPKAEPL